MEIEDMTAPKPTTLAKALLAAQTEMPAVDRDATNPHFGSSFISLGHLLAKVRPVLNKHGIVVAQFPSSDETGPTLVTLLLHESGEKLEFVAPLLLPKPDPQGQGSAITYMRRYALAAALGISDQEDDDGNAASEAPKAAAKSNGGRARPSDAQLKFMERLLKEQGAKNVPDILAYAKENLEGGRGGRFSQAIDALKDESKRSAALKALVTNTEEWQKGQSDVPFDDTNLQAPLGVE